MDTIYEDGDTWADGLNLSENERADAVQHWAAIRSELPFIDKRLTEIDRLSSKTDSVSNYRLNRAKDTLEEHIARIDKHSNAYKDICGRRPLPLVSQLSDRVMFDLAIKFQEPVTMQNLANAMDKVSLEAEDLTRQGFKMQYLEDNAEPKVLADSMRALEPTIKQHLSVIRFGLIAIEELVAETTGTQNDREVAETKRTDWQFSQGQLQGLQARFAAEHRAIKALEDSATDDTVHETLVEIWKPFREHLAKIYSLHAESFVLEGADDFAFDLRQAKITVSSELDQACSECEDMASILREIAPWLPAEMTSLENSGGLSKVRGFPTLFALASTYQDALRAQYGDVKRVEAIRQAMLEGSRDVSSCTTELRSLIEQADARSSLLDLYSSTLKWTKVKETDVPGMKVSDDAPILAVWRELDPTAMLTVKEGCAELLRSGLPASIGLDSDGNRSPLGSGSRHGKGKAAV